MEVEFLDLDNRYKQECQEINWIECKKKSEKNFESSSDLYFDY